MDSSTSVLPTSVRLTERKSFPTWYAQLKYHARARGIWSQIDPDAPDHQGQLPPELPDLNNSTDEELRAYQIRLSIHSQLASKIQVLWNWVYTSVDSQRLELAVLRASNETLQALLRELKKDLCPSDDDWKEQVRITYREITDKPLSVGTDLEPRAWITEWNRAYANAVLVDLPDIKGALPIRDFLRSATKYQRDWAQSELQSLARPGPSHQTPLTLEQYALWFATLEQNHNEMIDSGVYATLGGRSDGRSDGHKCPCRAQGTHKWEPSDCQRLQYALQGHCTPPLQSNPTAEEALEIRRRLKKDRFKALAEELIKLGWISREELRGGFRYPGSIVA